MSVPPIARNRDELDETLDSALESMLAATPSDSQCQRAVDRLRQQSPAAEMRLASSRTRPRKRALWAVAAGWLFCLLWLGAQTESWGEVVVDYRTAGTADRQPSITTDTVPSSPILRFVLIVHVFTMSAGFLGFIGVWLMTQWAWLLGWFGKQVGERLSRWSCRVLSGSVVLYGLGIGVGSVWAWQAWGSPWQWDAREALALVTLGIALLWYSLQPMDHEPIIVSGREQLRRRVMPPTLAFWMIILLFLLAPIYASDTHGFGRFALVNLVSGMALLNLGLVGCHWLFARKGEDHAMSPSC